MQTKRFSYWLTESNNQPIWNMLVGITGGIGSGKSAISRALRALGYPVYDTDSEAKRIIVENKAVRSQIEYLFGSDVFDGDRYRTDVVAQQVFADGDLLDKLNKVVHPAVCFDVRHWALKQNGTCFVESAILWESGLAELCDTVVEVTAPMEVRIERTMARDNASREQVQQRIASQTRETDMRAHANIILNNNGDFTPTQLAAELLHRIGINI